MDHEDDLHDKLIRQYCKGMERENRPIILSHSILIQHLVSECVCMYYFFSCRNTHIYPWLGVHKLSNLIEHPEFAKNGDPAWAIFMEDREVLFCHPDASCCAYSSFICPEYSFAFSNCLSPSLSMNGIWYHKQSKVLSSYLFSLCNEKCKHDLGRGFSLL